MITIIDRNALTLRWEDGKCHPDCQAKEGGYCYAFSEFLSRRTPGSNVPDRCHGCREFEKMRTQGKLMLDEETDDAYKA